MTCEIGTTRRSLLGKVWRLSARLLWLVAVVALLDRAPRAFGEAKAKPAQPRRVDVVEYVELEPTFARTAHTLDPLDVGRQGWKGYLTHMGVEEGLSADKKPMMRLYFDDRALPWASLKPHGVDGFDVNTRNVGAHAALHAMLGAEKNGDPAEAAQLEYIRSLTPEGPGSFIRHGEIAENLLDLYAVTKDETYKAWAEKVIRSLEPPVDSDDPMGGWLHLHVGWNIGAFAKWYALTGDKAYLAKAVACADRVTKSRDPDGDDGAFRPDGSFGGKSQTTTASWHMHGHTHIIPELLILGEQLIADGQETKGLETIAKARATFDWLYDPQRNPDAGSMTGWLGEWLMCATGWQRQSDCEGCTMGDMVETAVALGAASRLHPSLAGQVDYYDQAEQLFRGQIAESIFRQHPRYLEVVHECAHKRAAKGALGAVAWNDKSSKKNRLALAISDIVSRPERNGRQRFATLRFNGEGYFKADDSASLRATEFTIAAVVDVRGKETQTIYSNYSNPVNWGKGVNLSITPDRRVAFFTTDGTEAGYDTLNSDRPLPQGFHLIVVRYGRGEKSIAIDGHPAGSAAAKPLEYDSGTVAAVGALREFGFPLQGAIAELVILPSADPARADAVAASLVLKYAPPPDQAPQSPHFDDAILWLDADDGYQRERPEPTAADRAAEAERLYNESVETGKKLEGRLLGLSGFNDWVNSFPSTLDPSLPGIDMMGCCSDAVIRAAGAIWKETVTGDADETRVNMAFNRASPLVDVVSALPHRGEVNVLIVDARRVLVRVPTWAPHEKVHAFVDKQPIDVAWNGDYVVFADAKKGQQFTVTYPLRIATVHETVGSLSGVEYKETWRGNTIVDISPRGKWLPTFHRPELMSSELP